MHSFSNDGSSNTSVDVYDAVLMIKNYCRSLFFAEITPWFMKRTLLLCCSFADCTCCPFHVLVIAS